jgi:hypothetical protein
VKHYASTDFWVMYQELPMLLKQNPRHPSLKLKRIAALWSVRVGIDYRALGIDTPEVIQWIWIGSHADYDQFLL